MQCTSKIYLIIEEEVLLKKSVLLKLKFQLSLVNKLFICENTNYNGKFRRVKNYNELNILYHLRNALNVSAVSGGAT